MPKTILSALILLTLTVSPLSANTAADTSDEAADATLALDLTQLPTLQSILPSLVQNRLVMVGESHDQYAHHLNQLAVIRAMYETHPDMVIGMEFFQTPFQEVLDQFIDGDIDERQMLKETEYFERWRYDYRLYRPIMQYAREKGIRIVALNVPRELHRKVAREGLEALTDEEQLQIPEYDRSDEQYEARIRRIFHQHQISEERKFENFLDAQLLWDEGMANNAATFLTEHPTTRMVLLAGSGHLAYHNGIPDRLTRRITIDSVVVLNDPKLDLEPTLADYILYPKTAELPPKGLMGIFMRDTEKGIAVSKVGTDSAADAVGIQEGDSLLAIEGTDVDTTADVKAIMVNRLPGDTITVTIKRHHFLAADETMELEVTLQ